MRFAPILLVVVGFLSVGGPQQVFGDSYTGVIRRFVTDHRDGRSETRYYLSPDDNGPSFSLRAPSTEVHLLDGAETAGRVRVQGVVIESEMPSTRELVISALESVEQEPLGTLRTLMHAPAPQSATGRHSIALVLLDFAQSTPTGGSRILSHAMDRDELTRAFFSDSRSARQIYEESSFGQLSFVADSDHNGSPDIFGPFVIPQSAGNCDHEIGWLDAGFQAINGVIDTDQYDHIGFIIPVTTDLRCSWIGSGFIGANGFLVGTNTSDYGTLPSIPLAHELGHNLGLAHAAIDPENDGTVQGAGQEYGDESCVMSADSAYKIFNAAHTYQLGWTDAVSHLIAKISKPGIYTYSIAPLERGTKVSLPQVLALRIVPPTARSLLHPPYILSYRQNVDPESALQRVYRAGVSVTRDVGIGQLTRLVSVLRDESVFSDPNLGFDVRQIRHDTSGADITVRIYSAQYIAARKAAPSVRRLEQLLGRYIHARTSRERRSIRDQMVRYQAIASIRVESLPGAPSPSVTRLLKQLSSAMGRVINAKPEQLARRNQRALVIINSLLALTHRPYANS